MLYSAGLSNNSGTVPAKKADVINMSLGGPGYSSTFQNVVNQVRAAGVVVIAAAGNGNTSTPSYPAAYDGVVSVSSVGQDLTRAYYSNFGSTIDVAAPGGDSSKGNTVFSTVASDSSGSIVDTYAGYQGTSMAAPHVAAVAALMKEANPMMTPADFDNYLASGLITDDHGTVGRDDIYGHGLINAAKAITVAGEPIPASFLLDSTSVTFAGTTSTKTINVSNGGTEEFSAAAATSISYTSGTNWLSISSVSVDANNLGSYELSVDRTGLADGEYQAAITFSAPGSSPAITDAVLNVTLRVGLDVGVDAGYQYIIIENYHTGERLGAMEAVPVDGLYQYSFAGIPAGEYRIVAGTDMDNDFYFCNTGEACGSYSSLPLVVSGNTSGLNFITGFTAAYGLSSAASDTESAEVQGFSK
ncbi:MAG: S8 family serine peptidase [Gammaproteobacteria bacterium]|nr:S8 family serine peptidase [Gammaproteobacteria bacterium]